MGMSGVICTGSRLNGLEDRLMTSPLRPLYRKIRLTQGQYALVDTSDYDWLSQWKWWAQWYKNTQSFYAARRGHDENGKPTAIMMHREILGLEHNDPREGDHRKPGKTLDNRRKNLRSASLSQSAMNRGRFRNNTSGYKGVYPYKGKFVAHIQADKKRIRIGTFSTAQQAARAYRTAARQYHCDFAYTKGK